VDENGRETDGENTLRVRTKCEERERKDRTREREREREEIDFAEIRESEKQI
jgi:hypothetical protein